MLPPPIDLPLLGVSGARNRSSGRSGGHDAKETAEDGSREISVENNSYGNMFGLLLRQRQSMLK